MIFTYCFAEKGLVWKKWNWRDEETERRGGGERAARWEVAGSRPGKAAAKSGAWGGAGAAEGHFGNSDTEALFKQMS